MSIEEQAERVLAVVQGAGSKEELRDRVRALLVELSFELAEREQQVVQRERHFRELTDLVPVAIVESDLQGRVQSANQMALDLFGFDGVEAATGARVLDFVSVEDRDRGVQNIAAHLRGEPVGATQYRMHRTDGTSFVALVHSSAVRDGDRAVGLRTAVLDVTERTRADEERRLLERQLYHAQKLESLGVLAGGIAHDFNNLLAAILANADLALLDAPPESDLTTAISQIRTAAVRASELTSQILAYSGTGKLVVEKVDLNGVVTEMAQLLSASISKKAALAIDLAMDMPVVAVDPSQLRQVVMNLITNASDALEGSEGTVTLRTRSLRLGETSPSGAAFSSGELPPGPYACLEVVDSGTGIRTTDVARIFEPFYTTRLAGRGLGLAAVLGIVRSHRGSIEVETTPGEGSLFRVLLPLEMRWTAESVAPAARAQPDWRTEGTVLVVDDEAGVAAAARRILRRVGFEVILATDGQHGVDVFREHRARISVVLLDLVMPRMGGAEALREMRAIRSDIPVILCSGYVGPDELIDAEAEGIASFLHKPFGADELVDAVRRALEPV